MEKEEEQRRQNTTSHWCVRAQHLVDGRHQHESLEFPKLVGQPNVGSLALHITVLRLDPKSTPRSVPCSSFVMIPLSSTTTLTDKQRMLELLKANRDMQKICNRIAEE